MNEAHERERALNASIIESLQEGLIVIDLASATRRATPRCARSPPGCGAACDMVARTGGDEFVVVLPDLAPAERAALDAADRIQAAS